jgi:hypothetical protein
MPRKQSKAIAKKGKKKNLPAAPINYEADKGRGLEGADKDSYAIPFIAILQPLSPQVAGKNTKIKGAQPGMFMETVTNELFDELNVIPCAFQRRYIRWTPRDQGGGFKGIYLPSEVEAGKVEGAERGADGFYHIDGDDLNDTRMHFVLFQSDNGSWKPAILSLSSSQVKKSRRWMSLIHGIELENEKGKKYNPPSFSHTYTITADEETNEKGTWWGIDVEVDKKITDAGLYNAARAFNEDIVKGMATPLEPTQDASEGF